MGLSPLENPAKYVRCNAITVIVLSCLAPWCIVALYLFASYVGILLIILGGVITALQITAGALALSLGSPNAKRVKRMLILVFSVIGAAFHTAIIAVWISFIIAVRVNSGTMVFGSFVIIIFGVLLAVDACFKVPLIANLLMLGIRVFKYVK